MAACIGGGNRKLRKSTLLMEHLALRSRAYSSPGELETPRESIARNLETMTLDALLRESAALTPERIAAIGPDGAATFARLDGASDRVGIALLRFGVRKGDRVLVCLPKSIRALTVIQGILRIGATYVLCDTRYSAARVAAIVSDCDPRLLIASSRLIVGFSAVTGGTGPRMLSTEDIDSIWATPPPGDAVRTSQSEPDEPAYVLYASSPTGRPKGVCISHRAALASIDWAKAAFAAGPEVRFANHAPLHSDFSVLDLYTAWSCGASVVLIPENLADDARSLVDILINRKITVWYSLPSVVVSMMEYGNLLSAPLENLRTISFRGEPLPVKYVHKLRSRLPHVRLWNLYGTIETNIVTAYEVVGIGNDRSSPIPIGKPICGNRVWARSPSGGEANIEEPGELIVSGPTVMLGYCGAELGKDHLCATGDIVRRLPDGNFEYLGRRDHRIEIAGCDVEPGEIEAALVANRDVLEAAVVPVEIESGKCLVAFVIPSNPHPRLTTLKKHCSRLLPFRMVPQHIRFLPALPRTDTGKIDRPALIRLAESENIIIEPEP
jgi:amino acid adenylation domain-containing protein